MSLEFTRDKVIENYVELNNIDDLFDSDILIIPWTKEGAFRLTQPLEIKHEYEDLKIKYYAADQENLRYNVTASDLDIIFLGYLIVSNFDSLIRIADFLMNKYENKTSTIININLFNKTENNKYILNPYEGDINNFKINELDKMKDDFSRKPPSGAN